MKLVKSFLINALVIYAAGEVFSGIRVSSYMEALVVVLLLSIVNAFVRPLLILLTLPITLATLGLFLLVINGGMVLLVDRLLEGFHVDGWSWAILLSVVLAVSNMVLGSNDTEKKK